MVRHLLVIVLATCWTFAVGAIAESSSGELHSLSQNDLHVNSREVILNDEHRRFARQATTKKVTTTTKKGATTKKGIAKKANLVAATTKKGNKTTKKVTTKKANLVASTTKKKTTTTKKTTKKVVTTKKKTTTTTAKPESFNPKWLRMLPIDPNPLATTTLPQDETEAPTEDYQEQNTEQYKESNGQQEEEETPPYSEEYTTVTYDDPPAYEETYADIPVSGTGTSTTSRPTAKSTTNKSAEKTTTRQRRFYIPHRQSRYFNVFSFNRRYRGQRWWRG